MAELGVDRVPVLHRLAPGPARRAAGQANDAGPGFLRPADRRAARARASPRCPPCSTGTCPQPLEDEGGWLARDTALPVRRLRGAGRGPARRPDPAVDHAERALRGHGVRLRARHPRAGPGADARRAAGRPPPAARARPGARGPAGGRGARQVAITNNYAPAWPASDSPADLAAADAYDTLQNRLFTDPVLLGPLPGPVRVRGRSDDPDFVRDGDLAADLRPDRRARRELLQPRPGCPRRTGLRRCPSRRQPVPGYPVTAFGWPVVPAGLRRAAAAPARARTAQALPPVYITENGCSADDAVTADGTVDDQPRIGTWTATSGRCTTPSRPASTCAVT